MLHSEFQTFGELFATSMLSRLNLVKLALSICIGRQSDCPKVNESETVFISCQLR